MRYLVIDCETTGLSHDNNKVLTVGMLNAEITKRKIKVIDESHIKVKHDDYNPNRFAMMFNKINLTEHHKVAIYPKLSCKKINNFIKDQELEKAPVLGHNLRFDFRFLGALQHQGKTEFKMSWNPTDTMMIWRELKAQGKIPLHFKSSLRVLSEYFNVCYDCAHDAVEDCKITAEVYHRILKEF